MGVLETEFKKFRQEVLTELREIKKMIATRMTTEKWVQQDIACAMLNVKPRQLGNIRIHMKDGQQVGSIAWKKGKGKNVLYYLPDIEKYNSAVIIK